MTTPILEASGLHKSFGGVRAVDDVSFALHPGEMLALIGPNGAGKSTCFNILGGQLRPDVGQIRLRGHGVTGLRPWRRARLGLGRSFQVAEICGSMTVRENVQLALIAHHRHIWRTMRALRHHAVAHADRLLAQAGLEQQATMQAGVLAYGDSKRLELALALATDPVVLLMDEPTAGMAAAERAALIGVVRQLAAEQSLAVLFTEHDMDVVFGSADRVLVMNRGRLIASGSPDAVRADPHVRAVYLGEAARC
jgi:branched-chain amino acid transport system ATP-binding protein